MKVFELIAELQKYHPNLPVFIPKGQNGVMGRIEKVKTQDDQMGGEIVQIFPYNFPFPKLCEHQYNIFDIDEDGITHSKCNKCGHLR